MKYKTLLSVLAFVGIGTLFAGCASLTGAESEANLSKLQPGMTQSKVISLLGTPDSVIQTGENDKWIYEFRTQAHQGHNTFVEFHSGLVVKSGELSGREVAAAAENRTPGSCTKWGRPEFRFESLCIR